MKKEPFFFQLLRDKKQNFGKVKRQKVKKKKKLIV